MPVDANRNGSGSSDSASQGLSSLSHVVGLAADDQGVSSDGHSAGMGDTLPPLGVKLTCYRLINVMTVIGWAIPKAILSYKNRSIAATTVDLFAALFGLALYWVGLYERKPGRKQEWFFRVDLAPAFGHSASNIVGGVAWALSFLSDMLVDHPFISLFLLSVCLLLARYLPGWGAAVVSIGLTLPVVIIFMSLVISATSGRG